MLTQQLPNITVIRVAPGERRDKSAARRAEAVVVIGRASDVEDIGVIKDVFVAIGRTVEQEDLVALGKFEVRKV